MVRISFELARLLTVTQAGNRGKYSFGAERPSKTPSSSQNEVNHQTQPHDTTAETVRHDFFEERPQWPFSCYAPFPKMRSEAGSDTSFEELRYYEMKLIKIDRKPVQDVIKETAMILEQVRQRTQSYYNQKCGHNSENVGNQMLLIKRGPQLNWSGLGEGPDSSGVGVCTPSPQECSGVSEGLATQSNDISFEENLNPPSEKEFVLEGKDNPWLADEFEIIPDEPPPEHFLVWGAGTDVGKTLISAAYAFHSELLQKSIRYIKPVQTGFPDSSDARFVARVANGSLHLGPHAMELDSSHQIGNKESRVECHLRFAWRMECSPHLAVTKEGRSVSDMELVSDLVHLLYPKSDADLTLVETAGGVSSPSPSGSLQCDVYRSARMPCILVGDSKLGGISNTLTAYDSLIMRGYEIAAIPVILNEELNNCEFLEKLMFRLVHWQGFQRGLVIPFPKLPIEMNEESVMEWIQKSEMSIERLDGYLLDTRHRRFQRMATMTDIATKHYWWPFTQHKTTKDSDVTVVDSRQGQFLNTFKNFVVTDTRVPQKTDGELQPMFDACASWWTQGVDNTPEFNLQSELVRAMSFGASRFGHVIFAEVAHEPATRLTQKLLQTVGEAWASRVFFSDDGSTAIEVALKMAFGKYKMDNADNLAMSDKFFVLGFTGSYHGDTLGAMDCSPGSVFNQRVVWYRSLCKCLDPPTLIFRRGEWNIKIPETWPDDVVREMCHWSVGKWTPYSSITPGSVAEENFIELCSYVINTFIDECEEQFSEEQGRHKIGACVLEPVIQGAGGMIMIEPWFQRVVQSICEERDIPVIFDEVFTGLWRLGYISGAKMLNIKPDIACYGKLITGGLLPLGVTLASEDVFDAFEGESKEQALLHGHSYTAYPAACATAITAINIFHTKRFNPNLKTAEDGSFQKQNLPKSFPSEPKEKPQECILENLWDGEMVNELSFHPGVEGVVPVGTLLAVTLQVDDGEDAGYTSLKSKKLVMELRNRSVFTRPLGNVVYLLVAPNSSKEVCDWLLNNLLEAIRTCFEFMK
eukprot:g6284.t1